MAPAAIAEGGGLEATFSSSDPVVIDKPGRLELRSGALLAPDLTSPGRVELTATKIIAHVAWERGADASPDRRLLMAEKILETGEEELTFSNATLELSTGSAGGDRAGEPAPGARPQLLVLDEGWGPQMVIEPTGLARVIVAKNSTMAAMGPSPDNAGTGEESPASFWHRVGPPHTYTRLAGQATANGSFGLFVNNLTLTLHGEERTWTNWTGYRSDHPADGPTGPTRYERRVVVLTIVDGHLDTGDPVRLELASDRLHGGLDGILSTRGAYGELRTEAGSVSVTGEALQLHGQGRFHVTPLASDDAPEDQPTSGTLSLPMAVTAEGELSIQGPEAFPEDPVGTGGQGVWSVLAAPVAGVPLFGALAGTLLLGGLMVAAAVAVTSPEAPREPVTRFLWGFKHRHFYHLLDKGAELEVDGLPDQAIQTYRWATRLEPTRAIGWFHLSRLLLDQGETRQAAATLEDAAENVRAEPTELLEMRISAHWGVGDQETAAHLLRLLEDRSRTAAHDLVDGLELHELGELAGLSRGVDSQVGLGEGGLDGYA